MEKNTIVTAVSVAVLTVFIIFLYLSNRSEWTYKLSKLQEVNDSLIAIQQGKGSSTGNIAADVVRADSVARSQVYKNYFDPTDFDKFRPYGIFKDTSGTYTPSSLAERFNVQPPAAIKEASRVNKSVWFIVPVKGIHLVRKGENLEKIAKYYYFNPEDAALIAEFNPSIKEGEFVFIPFN